MVQTFAMNVSGCGIFLSQKVVIMLIVTYLWASYIVSLSSNSNLMIGIYLNSIGISFIIFKCVFTPLAIMLRFSINHVVFFNDDLYNTL